MKTYRNKCVHAKSLQSRPTLRDPMDCIARQAPLSMRFSWQEYRSGLPCLPPGGHGGAFKHPLFRIVLSWEKTYREKNYE